MYNVFFNDNDRPIYILRKDFKMKEDAESFLSSNWFSKKRLDFLFILKDGKKLIKGKHLKVSPTEEDFEADMKFALLLPNSEYEH